VRAGRWTYRVSAAGVVALAAAAFTLSYDALHQLALDSQVRPSLAWLWPVVIDGTIVVALLTVLAANRAARKAGYPWTLAGLFSAASVAFNIAHAPDRPVARLVFAMAPVALVLTTHLLMQQLTWRQHQPAASSAPEEANPDYRPGMSASPAGLIASIEHKAEPIRPTAADMCGPKPDLEARAREIYQQHHSARRRLSGAALAREIGTSERHGRRLLAVFRAEDEGSDRRNGDGAVPRKQVGPMRT
jgi:hypothetical protein